MNETILLLNWELNQIIKMFLLFVVDGDYYYDDDGDAAAVCCFHPFTR